MFLASVAKHDHATLGTANLQIPHDILDLSTRVLFFLFFFFPFPYSPKSGTPLANRRSYRSHLSSDFSVLPRAPESKFRRAEIRALATSAHGMFKFRATEVRHLFHRH